MWRNYLIKIAKEGYDWTDPKHLMLKFGISEKAAQQVIDRRITEIDEAVENELAKSEWESVNDE